MVELDKQAPPVTMQELLVSTFAQGDAHGIKQAKAWVDERSVDERS